MEVLNLARQNIQERYTLTMVDNTLAIWMSLDIYLGSISESLVLDGAQSEDIKYDIADLFCTLIQISDHYNDNIDERIYADIIVDTQKLLNGETLGVLAPYELYVRLKRSLFNYYDYYFHTVPTLSSTKDYMGSMRQFVYLYDTLVNLIGLITVCNINIEDTLSYLINEEENDEDLLY